MLPSPLAVLGWQESTDYLRAFIVASTISALVVPVSNEFHELFKHLRIAAGYRFMVGIVVTFTASMVVLISMRILFGTGGSLLASPDHKATLWKPSS